LKTIFTYVVEMAQQQMKSQFKENS